MNKRIPQLLTLILAASASHCTSVPSQDEATDECKQEAITAPAPQTGYEAAHKLITLREAAFRGKARRHISDISFKPAGSVCPEVIYEHGLCDLNEGGERLPACIAFTLQPVENDELSDTNIYYCDAATGELIGYEYNLSSPKDKKAAADLKASRQRMKAYDNAHGKLTRDVTLTANHPAGAIRPQFLVVKGGKTANTKQKALPECFQMDKTTKVGHTTRYYCDSMTGEIIGLDIVDSSSMPPDMLRCIPGVSGPGSPSAAEIDSKMEARQRQKNQEGGLSGAD